jgi:peptide-methionine (S)-S-oxide reductase
MHTAHALALVPLLLAACSGSVQHSEAPGDAAGALPEQPMETTQPDAHTPDPTPAPEVAPEVESEVATLGAGCFWCIEAVLEQLDGVADVTSGYMGGQVANPTYEAVSSGASGHAEVVQVTFDPRVLPYAELLDWFWRLHDPTTLNRQGNDVGTQYRSAIFVHSAAQRATAEASMRAAQSAFPRPIVTEITDASTYYVAEGYHQDYYRGNKSQGYCRLVIRPKLHKLGLDE